MYAVYIATFFSACALLTGILAVGSGKNFEFKPRDILRGQRNAILYIWVTLSTCFSLAHVVAVAGYIANPLWGDGIAIQMWFLIHAIVGILLTSAHAYIHFTLSDFAGRDQETMW